MLKSKWLWILGGTVFTFIIILLFIIVYQAGYCKAAKVANQGVINRMDKLENEFKTDHKALQDYIDPKNEDNIIRKKITNDYKRLNTMIGKYSNQVAVQCKIPKMTILEINEESSLVIANWLHSDLPFLGIVVPTLIHESGGHVHVIGPKGEVGPLQDYGVPKDTPWQATIRPCIQELNKYWLKYHDWQLVAYHYNGGEYIDRCPKDAIKRAKQYIKLIGWMRKQVLKEWEG